jgi:hypothetical protein
MLPLHIVPPSPSACPSLPLPPSSEPPPPPIRKRLAGFRALRRRRIEPSPSRTDRFAAFPSCARRGAVSPVGADRECLARCGARVRVAAPGARYRRIGFGHDGRPADDVFARARGDLCLRCRGAAPGQTDLRALFRRAEVAQAAYRGGTLTPSPDWRSRRITDLDTANHF